MDRREFLKTCGKLTCATGLLSLIPLQDSYAQTVQKGLLGVRASPWFQPAARNTLTCTLCPKSCNLSSGQRGVCRVRENRRGTGVTLTYGTPSLAQIDPVERIPFYHILPGIRTLSIATAGCPLECSFCEVWDMALVQPEQIHAYSLPPKEVVQFAQASKVRAISYAFGEPTAFFEYALDTALLARKANLLNLLHTSAYISPTALKELIPYLDGANIDLKSIDPGFYRTYCKGELEPILQNIQLLVQSGVHVELTHLVIPTLNDDQASLQRLISWIKQELGTHIPLHFSRFYPLYKLSNLPPTPVATLERAYTLAQKSGLPYVYLAKVTGHRAENTVCPQCKNTVIRRVGFFVEQVHLNKGCCNFCNHPIPGKWSL